MNFYIFISFIIPYLICGISPAIEICKRKTGEDIRNLGSGNAGTTNAIRVLGGFTGVVVFILDIIKAFIAYGLVNLVANLFKENTQIMLNSIFMVAAILGHCYPIYYSFKGGKGMVMILVIGYILNTQIFFVCVIAGIITILLTRIVSIGSVGGVILFDIMVFVMMPEYIVPVLIVSAIILFKHRSNIRRIFEGQENKLF